MIAFVIGNGPSRSAIDLSQLLGATYGCNAIYREFSPDYLVAVDKSMQDEIIRSGYTGRCIFRESKARWPSNVYVYRPTKGVPNNSGVVATYFALKNGARTVYLLGFDFKNPETSNIDNLYKGTINYTSHPRYRDHVEQCFSRWFEANSAEVKFIRVVDPKLSWTSKWGGLKKPHLTEMTVEEFNEQIQR